MVRTAIGFLLGCLLLLQLSDLPPTAVCLGLSLLLLLSIFFDGGSFQPLFWHYALVPGKQITASMTA